MEEETAKKEFERCMKENNEDICLDYKERHWIADDEILKLIEEKYGINKGFFSFIGKTKK